MASPKLADVRFHADYGSAYQKVAEFMSELKGKTVGKVLKTHSRDEMVHLIRERVSS